MSVVYAFSFTSLLHLLRFLLRNAKMTIALVVIWSIRPVSTCKHSNF
jgi:hypothetical protein